MLPNVDKMQSKYFGWFSMFRRELSDLEKKFSPTQAIIAEVGDTGACTAVENDSMFEADIEFPQRKVCD
jgi:hypothetical protein